MERALITRDFTVAFVADNGSSSHPGLVQRRHAVGGAGGIDPVVGAGAGRLHRRRGVQVPSRITDPLVGWAMLSMFAVAVFFFGLMGASGRPTRSSPSTPRWATTGPDPTRCCRNHILMAFHPPMLYLGYVGFTVPFAFAIAALVTGRLGEGWLLETRRWTLVAWGFLTAGIVLGAWWAYEVLGWGGYWGWDPVENASLAAVADRHRLPAFGDGAGAARHAAGLEPVAGVRHVLAHHPRHVPHPIGGARRRCTPSPSRGSARPCSASSPSSWWSPSGSSAGAVTCCGPRVASTRRCRARGRSCSTTCCSPRSPSWCCWAPCSRWWSRPPGRADLGRLPFFDRMSTPVGLALLFLMAVAPVLPWRKASGETAGPASEWPAWCGAGVAGGCRRWSARGAWRRCWRIALAGFAGGSARPAVWLATRRQGWRGLLGRANGGMIVHLGVVIMAVAIAASGSNVQQAEFTLEEGDSANVRRPHLHLRGDPYRGALQPPDGPGRHPDRRRSGLQPGGQSVLQHGSPDPDAVGVLDAPPRTSVSRCWSFPSRPATPSSFGSPPSR